MVSFLAEPFVCSTFHAVSQFTGPFAQMIVPHHAQFVSLMPKCLVIISILSSKWLFVLIYRKYSYFVPSNGSGSWPCDKMCFVVSTYGPVLMKWVTHFFTLVCFV